MIGAVIGKISGSGGGSSSSFKIIKGSGVPAGFIGRDGDFYIDETNPNLYGPKISGSWPMPPITLGGSGSNFMGSTGVVPVTSDGAQVYTLPVTNPSYIELYINGQLNSDSLFFINDDEVTISAAANLKVGDSFEFTFETRQNSSNPNDPNPTPTKIPIDEIPSGIINGINKVFYLGFVPLSNTLSVFYNGLRIDSEDYTLSEKVITFVNAPDKKIRALYYKQ